MASFSKVNGDFQRVMNVDTPSYTNAGLNATTDGKAVQPQGPKLEFLTFTAAGALTGADVAKAIQTIQQLSTVYMYQYNANGGSADSLAVAVYPVGAFDASSFNTALTDLGGNFASGTSAATATFTN